MKHVKFATIGASLALSLIVGTITSCNAQQPQSPPVASDTGFAVLELFTSEGCSSCPPADELVGRIAKASSDKPVYVLCYHVDYWDRLGWKDIFSDHRYAERQYAYGQQLGAQVYTPQLVVNGKAELVGSDVPAVREVLENALRKPAVTTLQASAQLQAGKLQVDYEVTGNTQRSRLLFAVVQKQAFSKVERGENAGRTLPHAQIVRDLQSYAIKGGGRGQQSLSLPAGFDASDWEVIGFVQQAGASHINAATRVVIK